MRYFRRFPQTFVAATKMYLSQTNPRLGGYLNSTLINVTPSILTISSFSSLIIW